MRLFRPVLFPDRRPAGHKSDPGIRECPLFHWLVQLVTYILLPAEPLDLLQLQIGNSLGQLYSL